MDCLDEETILAFIEGGLAPAGLAEVERHTRDCRSCQERVSAGFAAAAPRVDPSSPVSGADSAPPAAALAPLPAGTPVGRYTVLALVGQGGMGEVYAAHDPKLDRTIALKLLRPRGAGGAARGESRLMREAQAIARLSHQNVITVHDVGAHGDRVFLAMEYVEGRTLTAWLAERARPPAEIVAMFREAARGLAAAHAAGLVHRDFKPQNVMVARDGTVRVTDFGLARRMEGVVARTAPCPGAAAAAAPALATEPPIEVTLTRTGELIGTPLYMAPEQLALEAIDARSDQFSFCVALYDALYGEHPFLGPARGSAGLPDLVRALRAGVVRQPVARSRVPGPLRRALLRGLAIDPAARWPSMDDLTAALEPVSARERPRVAAVAASALAVTAIAAIAAILGLSSSSSRAGRDGALVRAERAATVAASISSDPPGARIVRVDDGALLGVTPFRDLRASRPGTQKLRLALDGYEDETIVVPLDRAVTLTLPLRRLPSEAQVTADTADARPVRPVTRPARVPEPRAPDPIERWLRPAEERLEAGHIAEACALGLVASEHARRMPAVWEFLGRCYMRLAEPQQARAYYRRYLQLAPSGPDAPFIRAIIDGDEP